MFFPYRIWWLILAVSIVVGGALGGVHSFWPAVAYVFWGILGVAVAVCWICVALAGSRSAVNHGSGGFGNGLTVHGFGPLLGAASLGLLAGSISGVFLF